MKYRKDIDGIRAIAVISVILFHLGYLPNGYLGVDVFFVISGFLITGILFNSLKNDTLSILSFYERRIRRIIPLLLTITSIAFLLGMLFMLPDDLENLCQSIVASNFSANNILMLITSSDYWAVKNEYKPLMHTWSLGIEEQFYLFYPFIFIFFKGKRIKYLKTIIVILTLISLTLFITSNNESHKFYLIQYRFFELAIGGLAMLFFNKFSKDKNYFKLILLFAFIALLAVLFLPIGSNNINIITITLLTAVILVFGRLNNNIYYFILTNKLMVYIGKISFSLYMWHHLIFAFSRYAFIQEITPFYAVLLSILTALLSIITYYFIETPFRKKSFKTKHVLSILVIVFLINTIAAFYIYTIGGIYKDYPSLSIYKNEKHQVNLLDKNYNIHTQYNERIRKLDTDFIADSKIKILIIGNSFGRDAVNVFLESKISKRIQVRYADINKITKNTNLKKRIETSDYVFIAPQRFIDKNWLTQFENNYHLKIDANKLYIFGIKDFGYSSGIHYNNLSKITNFSNYRTKMKKGIKDINNDLKETWKNQYINLIELVKDDNNNVLVFTPEGKFISQDASHLTKDGAQFFAKLLTPHLLSILK